MHIVQGLSQIAELHPYLVGLVIFLGVILEGELVLLATGILAHLEIFSIFFGLSIGFLGALMKTLLGYELGVFLDRKFPKSRTLHFIKRQVHALFPSIQTRPFLSIFLSKFIYGINHLTLVFCGFTKIPFKTYFKAEFLSSIIWVLGMFYIGYGFSHAAFSITKDIKKASLIVLLAVIGFLILQKVVRMIIGYYEESTVTYEE